MRAIAVLQWALVVRALLSDQCAKQDALPSSCATAQATPIRGIVGGSVTGKTTIVTSSIHSATVYQHLGIPFAAAPTGTLRFKPPQSPVLPAEIIATAFPNGCLQQKNTTGFIDDLMVDLTPESEDCLYLNVFAPLDTSNPKAVLFWIFGGDLRFGSSSINFYDGSWLAGLDDVVVVTHNYRTNIFGFPGQNLGLMDQRAALQWVADNIESFGGDPSRVVIFGESAGGYSVKQLLAHPPVPLNFHGAIIQSHALLVSGNGSARWEQTAKHFGCENFECMQKIDALTLRDWLNERGMGFDFPPVDDAIHSQDVRSSIDAGTWADVPLLLGTNSDEGRFFSYYFGILPGTNVTLAQALTGLFAGNEQLQNAVESAYTPFSQQVDHDVFLVFSRILTDFIFNCRGALVANRTVESGRSDTWRYYYRGSFPNLNFFSPEAGAYHTSELPQVFGTYDNMIRLGPSSSAQQELSRLVRHIWTEFAKDPRAGPGWPSMPSMGELSKQGVTTILPVVADEFCTVFEPVFNMIGW